VSYKTSLQVLSKVNTGRDLVTVQQHGYFTRRIHGRLPIVGPREQYSTFYNRGSDQNFACLGGLLHTSFQVPKMVYFFYILWHTEFNSPTLRWGEEMGQKDGENEGKSVSG